MCEPGELVRVLEDTYDIAGRLKEIDERYELFFNRRLGRFEIYANGALQIAAPFDRLDARLLDLAVKTRVEYADRLLSELEKHNRMVEEEQLRSRARALT